MVCFFLTINSITHPIRYLWWKVSANNLLEKVKNTIHSRLFAENE